MVRTNGASVVVVSIEFRLAATTEPWRSRTNVVTLNIAA
jgi:hypothetical protein